jgi:hypothetical protein
MEGYILCDKVQKIIDTFNLLSPENQGILFECAYNALKAANPVKKPVDSAPEREDEILEEGDTGLLK